MSGGALVETVAAPLHVARLFAVGVFLSLLLLLGVAFSRLRKQALHDAAEAALEADFRRLEAELSEPASLVSQADREGR